MAVCHDNILQTHGHQQADDGNARRPRAGGDDLHILQLLAHQLQGVDDPSQGDDRRAVLVVVEDGDITAHLQPFLNFKAPGSGDVLQVHAAKTPGQQPDRFHDLIHVLAADAERNRVHIAEGLEQHAFPLHDGHSRFWANITQAQHRRTVGHHRHGVPAAGQVVAGRIGQTQGLLGVHCRPGRNFQLAPQRIVHFQRFLCVIHHSFRLSCYFRCCIVWDFRRDRN